MEGPVHLHPYFTVSTPIPGASIRESSPHQSSSNEKSSADSTSIAEIKNRPAQRTFKSARLVGPYEKPWLQDKSYRKRERFDKVILGVCAFVGCAIAAFICWNEWNKIEVKDYCLILNDKFTTIDDAVWSHEVAVGGFGYGSFDWTTSDPANSYVSSSGLHIVPTITTDSTDITSDQLLNGYTLDLQSDGTCTSPDASQCIRTSNSSQTNGTIINPVRSARLTTAGKLSIKYGRIEVVAKMPKGDWLWPQIWLYPETETYGPFPRSGQIDLAGLRGNSYQSYIPSLGRDTVSSALHWGPMPALDQSWQTSGKLTMRRQDLAAGWHTYGLEWSETQLWTWIDSRVYQVVHMGFGPSYGGNLYQRGGFGTMWSKDGGLPPDAWSQTGALNTPFDQPFHLVINLAVGASNGFFPDNKGNKPWLDGTASAMKDFWNAYGVWGATWGAGEDRGLTVRSVKVWQQGKCTA